MPFIELRQSDAFRLLEEIPDETIDLIVVDIPYESLEKHRKKGTTTAPQALQGPRATTGSASSPTPSCPGSCVSTTACSPRSSSTRADGGAL